MQLGYSPCVFARYAKYIGYYTSKSLSDLCNKFARYDDVILHLLIIFSLWNTIFLTIVLLFDIMLKEFISKGYDEDGN